MKEIIKLFFQMGLYAFGGPAAHIAMLHREVVEKRKWVSEDDFINYMGATNLIPGPNSTEMVLHVGAHRGGKLGLMLAGFFFILPAAVLTGLLGEFYRQRSVIPNIDDYLLGIKAIVLILIFQAVKKLWKKAVKETKHYFVVGLVVLLVLLGVNEVVALFCGALFYLLLVKVKPHQTNSVTLLSLFLFFFKTGSILFGSGMVLIGYIQTELVETKQWLTLGELADAIALGQFTPGPVLTTATFIGQYLMGIEGAILATLGMFFPAFFFVLFLGKFLPVMQKSKGFNIFLSGLNAGSLALMLYTLYPLGKFIILETLSLITLAIGIFLIVKFPKLDSWKLILIGILTHAFVILSKDYFLS